MLTQPPTEIDLFYGSKTYKIFTNKADNHDSLLRNIAEGLNVPMDAMNYATLKNVHPRVELVDDVKSVLSQVDYKLYNIFKGGHKAPDLVKENNERYIELMLYTRSDGSKCLLYFPDSQKNIAADASTAVDLYLSHGSQIELRFKNSLPIEIFVEVFVVLGAPRTVNPFFAKGLNTESTTDDLKEAVKDIIPIEFQELMVDGRLVDLTATLSKLKSAIPGPIYVRDTRSALHADDVIDAIDTIGAAPVSVILDQNSETYPVDVKTMLGKTITVEGVKGDDTVDSLMSKIETKEGIPKDQQRLLFGSPDARHVQQLVPSRLLVDYGLFKGSTLYMILRLRGGMFHETSGRVDYDVLGSLKANVKVFAEDGETLLLSTNLDGHTTVGELKEKLELEKEDRVADLESMTREQLIALIRNRQYDGEVKRRKSA